MYVKFLFRGGRRVSWSSSSRFGVVTVATPLGAGAPRETSGETCVSRAPAARRESERARVTRRAL